MYLRWKGLIGYQCINRCIKEGCPPCILFKLCIDKTVLLVYFSNSVLIKLESWLGLLSSYYSMYM
jgi:hypothetical protein